GAVVLEAREAAPAEGVEAREGVEEGRQDGPEVEDDHPDHERGEEDDRPEPVAAASPARGGTHVVMFHRRALRSYGRRAPGPPARAVRPRRGSSGTAAPRAGAMRWCSARPGTAGRSPRRRRRRPGRTRGS